MTCKDCIHNDVCKAHVIEGVGIDFTTFEKLIEKNGCDQFKDRSKFIELLCKVGDIVYCLDRDNNIVRETINSIRIYDTGIVYFANYTFAEKDFGDIIFLTYEEAEKALKERKVELI